MQFYKACNFTIPQFFVDGQDDEMLINLGFQRRKVCMYACMLFNINISFLIKTISEG